MTEKEKEIFEQGRREVLDNLYSWLDENLKHNKKYVRIWDLVWGYDTFLKHLKKHLNDE